MRTVPETCKQYNGFLRQALSALSQFENTVIKGMGMGVLRCGMLSVLIALGGITATAEGKTGICEGGWIKTATLEDIAEQLEAAIKCSLGQEPLISALQEGAGIDKIRLLVANDRIAKPSGPWHHSPLHVAAAISTLEIVELMLDRGYEVNGKSSASGQTPLHLAAQDTTDPRVIDLLVESGAKIDPRDNSGRMPVHLAASFNPKMTVLQALLNHGANTSSRTNRGFTTEPMGTFPFHLALLL